MAIEKKQMQQRYGTYEQFISDKKILIPNSLAVVTSGDPSTADGKAVYLKIGTGEPVRLLTTSELSIFEKILNKISDKTAITSDKENYPSIAYLKNYYYDIDETYSQEQVDELLSLKLDNSARAVKEENIAQYAVGNYQLANRCITNSKIYPYAITRECIAPQAVTVYNLSDGAVEESKLSDDVVNIINSKYNASNVEEGIGTLTASDTNTDKINSASFEYQKIGSYVNVHIYIDFKAFSISNTNQSISLSGLPFVCCNTVNPRELCITSQKKQLAWAIARNSSSLTLLFLNTDLFAENEKLSFSLRYKIE